MLELKKIVFQHEKAVKQKLFCLLVHEAINPN